jgi:predicted nicotinamide N-methyase
MFLGTDLKSHVLQCSSIYLWAASEIEEAEKATLLLAADVIYSDGLTDLFFDTVRQLMSRGVKKVSSSIY